MSNLKFGSLLTADLREDTITFQMEEPIEVKSGFFAIIKCDTLAERIAIEEFAEELKNR